MISRQCRNELREQRRYALKQYEKHRQRNVLAKPGAHRFVVVLDHLKAGYNAAKILRSSEVFGAHEVHLIDIGPFDPAPAKGAMKRVPLRFYDDFESSYRDLIERGYTLYALQPGAVTALTRCRLPQKSAFILGHEEHGLSFELDDYPEIQGLTIPQFGATESLNVSVAASIVMYEYTRQHEESA